MQLPQHTIAQSTYTDLNRLNKLKVGEDRDSEANLRQVAREFESLFISEMMKAMRLANDVLADDLFNSNESKTYRDMYDQQMAVTLSQGKGMGMADVLVRQMEGLQQGRARPNPFAEAKTVLENTTEAVREPARAADSRQATTEREGNRAAPGIAVDKPKYVHVADTTDIRFRRFTGIVARPAVQHLRLDSAPDKQAGAAAGSQALRSYAQIKHSLPVAPGQLTQKTRFDSPEEFVAAMMPMAEQAAQRLGVDPKYLVAQAALAPGYPDSQFEIRFNDPANPKNYEIVETSTGTSLQTGSMDDDDKLHDTLVFAGVVVHLDGVPDGTETISIKADPAREKQGVLDTIYQLRTALENNTDSPEGSRATRDAVAAAITNIDHAMVTIDQTRGDIGARMNIIETTQTNNEDVTLVNQAVQAELREVDYPEALSKLAFQSIILEAAQQSYVKVSNLNLFNKM